MACGMMGTRMEIFYNFIVILLFIGIGVAICFPVFQEYRNNWRIKRHSQKYRFWINKKTTDHAGTIINHKPANSHQQKIFQ